MNDPQSLTLANGAPVADNLNIKTAGPRGPALLDDIWLIEKLAHFDREVIPERRMHAKGSGAYGTFTVTHDISRHTKAAIFSEVGKQTPLFLRFSTVAGERGAADAERDIRGFGSHTYSMINAANERVWVKFHFRCEQGIENLADSEAAAVIGGDRESHGRDLLEAIDRGDYPHWTLCIQVMTEEEAKTHKHNPFDLTKTWPKADYPLMPVGTLELNRNPENVFAEVEQAAFTPANLVPGIGISPDKMLQARLFSYGDAQRYRLGVNHGHIPVNAPRCPYHSYHRDGAMRTDGNLGATLSYFPNSHGAWGDRPDLQEPPLELDGAAAHWDHRVDDDHWEQPGNLFRLMSPEQQQLLFENTARQIGGASLAVQQRHVANCARADPAYGTGVARALGIDLNQDLAAAAG